VRRHYGVTDGRFKLIHFYEEDVDEWELYDLKFDADELTNLYDHSNYLRVQTRLHGELDRLRRKLDVPKIDPAATDIKRLPPRARTPTR
jgi:hypothetical protein